MEQPRNPALTRWHWDRRNRHSLTHKIYPYALSSCRLNTGGFSSADGANPRLAPAGNVLPRALILMDREPPETAAQSWAHHRVAARREAFKDISSDLAAVI